MPMFDFYCPDCDHSFEELVFGDEKAECPKCGRNDLERGVSAPSPLKTGAFPYKIGPVHSRVATASSSSPGAACGGACANAKID